MDLFKRKTKPCIICGKIASHMHKPKKEWNLEGKLCGDCHVDKTKEYYEGKARQPCVTCGTSYKITDLWDLDGNHRIICPLDSILFLACAYVRRFFRI